MIAKYRTLQAAIAACLSVGITAGQAGAFTFTKIADTNDGYSSFGRGLSQGIWPEYGSQERIQHYQNGISINSKGEVGFLGNLPGGQAILKGNGKKIDTIAQTGDIFSRFNQGISINQDGTVAFFANLVGIAASRQGIYSSKGGDPKSLAFGLGFAPGLSLNDSGTAAYFQAGDIYSSDGKDIVNITGCNGLIAKPPGCVIIPQRPSINNDGTVVYSTKDGILSSDGEIFADTNNFREYWFMDPSINDLGRTVFHTHLHGAGRGIFTSDGSGDNDFIAGNTNPFTWIQSPSINKPGTVAFLADLPAGKRGIYIGHNLSAEVIATGDFLNGSIVTDISLDRESINTKGQIAFWAKLANGTEGIFRADPEKGETQFDPLLPDFTTGELYSFRNAHPYLWYDPPSAYGFKFEMVDNSLFDSIVNFPLGFDNPFTVSVGSTVLGDFEPGDSVDFVSLLGSGVSEFTVTGLDVDPTDPTVFPIQLDFNTDLANFDMIALLNEEDPDDRVDVPEPSGVLSLLIFGAFGISALRKRKLS